MLAINPRTSQGARFPALTLTTIASMLAPTGVAAIGHGLARIRLSVYPSAELTPLRSFRLLAQGSGVVGQAFFDVGFFLQPKLHQLFDAGLRSRAIDRVDEAIPLGSDGIVGR